MRSTVWLLYIFLGFVGAMAHSAETAPVPDEYFLAAIPELPALGASRTSWAFVRPPYIWTMGQLIRIDQLRWPQWDSNQVPAALVPQQAGTWITLFDESGKVLKHFELKTALVPGKSDVLKDLRTARFQIEMRLAQGRVILKSPIYEWIQRKEIFHCDVAVSNETKIAQAHSLIDCVKTLAQLPRNSRDQWYVNVEWPHPRSPEWKEWIGEQDRTLRGIYHQAKDVYESHREGAHSFRAEAGMTNKEKIRTVEFPTAEVQKTQALAGAATREEKSKALIHQTLPEGAELTVDSQASDTVEDRDLKMPAQSGAGLRVQFVKAADDQYGMRETEFEESRTGLYGSLRPWFLDVYGTYNEITSNRGESDSFFNSPGFDVRMNWESVNLKPYGFFETGTLHSGSTLSISEFQVGANRHFAALGPIEPGIGYHHYSLSGRNPGSSRLGTMDAFVAGAQGVSLMDSGFLRGGMEMLVSNTLGYGAEIHWGRFLDFKKKDLRFFWGPFIGFDRYASKASNRLQEEETFTEDRWKFGLEFGMVGPDYFDGR